MVKMEKKHSAGFLRLVEAARAEVREVSVVEAYRVQQENKEARLIDVREESEWWSGHAVGAIHLSKGVLERDIEERVPDRGAPLYLYCGGGYRSVLAAQSLMRMNYERVYSVAGGYRAWVRAGLPTTTLPEVLPRSPYERLGGIVHLPRLIDKARLYPLGKLQGYNYLTVGFDKYVLDFLCVDGKDFEEIVWSSQTDEMVLEKLKVKLGASWPSDHAINEFNAKLIHRRPDTTERRARFEQMRKALPQTRRRVETYFDLIDLEEGRFRDEV
jgi:rhodanese-related sulfurtransferase